MAWLGEMTAWHWLALGVLLMVVEVMAPGFIFLWLGISAVVTGLVLAAVAIPWEAQLVLFAVLSVVASVAGRRWLAARRRPSDHPTLNRRGDDIVETCHTLDEATSRGRGQVRIGDSVWRLRVRPDGSDLPAGARVRVVRVEGSTLVVEDSG